VVLDREDPTNIELWRCTTCGEIKRICPRCDRQGCVQKVVVGEKNISVYLCDECDATWERAADIGGTGENFEQLMERHGINEPWKTTTFISEYEPRA
jgi:hypothetical protein